MDSSTATPPSSTSDATDRLARFYGQISPAHLLHLDRYYARDACFKDPFNEVQGIAAITHIFEHMFASLKQPHFVITTQVVEGQQAFLIWEFRFHFRRWQTDTLQCIRGATHLRFNPQGLVELHRDYWDAAEELYEKLPAIGALMRWLRRQASR